MKNLSFFTLVGPTMHTPEESAAIMQRLWEESRRQKAEDKSAMQAALASLEIPERSVAEWNNRRKQFGFIPEWSMERGFVLDPEIHRVPPERAADPKPKPYVFPSGVSPEVFTSKFAAGGTYGEPSVEEAVMRVRRLLGQFDQTRAESGKMIQPQLQKIRTEVGPQGWDSVMRRLDEMDFDTVVATSLLNHGMSPLQFTIWDGATRIRKILGEWDQGDWESGKIIQAQLQKIHTELGPLWFTVVNYLNNLGYSSHVTESLLEYGMSPLQLKMKNGAQ